MRIQAFGYFGMQGIGNVNRVLPNPLTVSDLTKLSGGDAIEMQIFYDRLRLDIIAKAIEVSITKTYHKKLRLRHGEYEL